MFEPCLFFGIEENNKYRSFGRNSRYSYNFLRNKEQVVKHMSMGVKYTYIQASNIFNGLLTCCFPIRKLRNVCQGVLLYLSYLSICIF